MATPIETLEWLSVQFRDRAKEAMEEHAETDATEVEAARDCMRDMLAALKDMRAQYGRLHDFLSDMIESGRVTEADLPDDYRAIADQLEACATADAGAESAIFKAEGGNNG